LDLLGVCFDLALRQGNIGRKSAKHGLKVRAFFVNMFRSFPTSILEGKPPMYQVVICQGCSRSLTIGLISVAIVILCRSAPAMAMQDIPSETKLYCEYLPPAEKANGKTIVLLSGDEEYRSEELMPMLGKVLSQHHGFHCYVLFAINPATGEIDPNNQSNIPGLNFLKEADLVIMAWRFRNPPDDQMQHFVDYFESGRPMIALRTSTHAFSFKKENKFHKYSYDSQDWPGGFGKQILGETWVSHHGKHGSESTRGIVVQEQADHPILKGVNDVWGPSDVYGINELPEDATVIMRGQILKTMEPTAEPVDDKRNAPMMPLVWFREMTAPDRDIAQRIVTTTMGAATDFKIGDLARLVVNASFWCLSMEDKITPDLNVTPLDSFEPTPFGFNSFKKGMKPGDFTLQTTPEAQTAPSSPDSKEEHVGVQTLHPQLETQALRPQFSCAKIDGTENGWRPMGREDFQNVNCDDNTWTWRDDGSVECTGNPVGVIRSVKEYKNFEMILEWQHQKKAGNSGVFVWSPLASLDKLKPGQLPQGIECQVLDHGYTEAYEKSSGNKADWFTTDGDVFPCAGSKMKPFSPAAPDGVRSFPNAKHSKGFGQWNHYYIRAINGEVRLWVNGHEVSGGTDCEPATGHICLESEGSPILFRDLCIREVK
jgi:hypothetical protein